MVLVIVAQDRKYSDGSLNCFELRKIRHVAPLPDTPAPRQVYVQQQLLKKSWVLSKRLKIKMPELHAASEQKQSVVEINATSPTHPSAPKPPSPQRQPNSQNHDDEPLDIIRALDKKRKQLDDQIANYVAERNEEYRRFEAELRSKKGPSSLNLPKTGVKSENIGDQDNHVLHVDAPQTRAEATRKSVHETVFARDRQSDAASLTSSTQSSTDGTPAHDREKEFRGLFTPSYLPLLDSRNYRPELSSEVGDNGAALQAEAVIKKSPSPSLSSAPGTSSKLPRTRSSPLVETQQPTSSLKHPRKVSRSKKVSFNIDNRIVAPADRYEEHSSPSLEAVISLSASPATQPAVSQPLPPNPSDNSIAATEPLEVILLDSSQTSSTESRLQPVFRNHNPDGSSEASLQNTNGQASTLSAVMPPGRNVSGSAYENSKQLSSIYEEEDLMFGLDGDAIDTESKPPGPSTSPMSPGDRSQSSGSTDRGIQGLSSSPTGQSGPDDPASSSMSGNLPRQRHVSDTGERQQRYQPLTASDSASSPMSPPMAIRGARHRRSSSTYRPISPILSPRRTVLSPSDPNFTAFVRDDPNFSTFVGGVRGGTGIDPSDRNSYGYPPSVGESYMQRNFRRHSDETAGSSSRGAVQMRRQSNAGRATTEADGEDLTGERQDVED